MGLSSVAKAPVSHGVEPTILRQVRAFALAVTSSEPPAVHRRGYRERFRSNVD
jgi:hypothetical protein